MRQPLFGAVIAAVLLAGVGTAATQVAAVVRVPPRDSVAAAGKAALVPDTPTPDHFHTAPIEPATQSVRVPILVYHIVRPVYASDSAEVRLFRVPPGVFTQQMQWLKTAGYTVTTYARLEDYFAHSTPLPPHPVILNFDDGWEDQYTYAFPVLEKEGYTATFFVPSNFPGNSAFLSWEQLHAMVAAGMTIGDHTQSHPYLTQIESTSSLWAQIEGSKQVLEQHLGVSVRVFNYPFGAYTPRIVALVKAAGYEMARTEAHGVMQSPAHPFKLKALNAPTTLAGFQADFPRQSS